MLFGRDLRLPADLLFSRLPDAPLAPEEYIEKLQVRMEEMHHLARERIGMAYEKMKTRYNARATGHDFHKGDKLWLWNPKRHKGLSTKLQTNWEAISQTVNKEIHCLVNKMEDLLLEHHPLKDIDTNLPPPDASKSGNETEKELSFEEHCQHEYKKLKDLLLQKANVN
ncbi:retrovirus-related Pol polyprotein from transposon 412 [Trichonephila clavipes]|nr:retrovirus-related Pol polyprotein from transposon 412 [Trichonephila clavipes]